GRHIARPRAVSPPPRAGSCDYEADAEEQECCSAGTAGRRRASRLAPPISRFTFHASPVTLRALPQHSITPPLQPVLIPCLPFPSSCRNSASPLPKRPWLIYWF